MKANVIKQLHELGVYRDPNTKQKLENMKLADILSVMSYVQEEIEKGQISNSNGAMNLLNLLQKKKKF